MIAGIIADDLTGALDTAAAFHRHGFSAEVWTPPLERRGPDVNLPDVLALNTDTRTALPTDARRTAGRATALLRDLGARHLYKKIDSTLRGRWVEEVAVVRQALEVDLVPLCPAFPSHGRVVQDGMVIAHDRNLGSCLLALWERGQLRAAPLPALGEFPPAEAAALLRRAAMDGYHCTVADAVTDADLRALAATAHSAGRDRLLCGSAGLAAAWAELLPGAAPRPSPSPHAARVLLIQGSRQEVARAQYLALERAIESGSVDAGRVQVVETPWLGFGALVPGAGLALACITFAQKTSLRPEALVVVGGATAAVMMRMLGADRLRLEGEFEPGVPLARIVGGPAEGTLLVTKAGGFGEVDLLVRIARALTAEETARHG